MKAERASQRFMPWAGLVLGTFGAGFAHQLGAASTFQDCHLGSPLIVVIGVVVGLILVGLGALGSWRVYAATDNVPSRRMIAAVSLMACGIYAVALILPFIASLVIPRCWA